MQKEDSCQSGSCAPIVLKMGHMPSKLALIEHNILIKKSACSLTFKISSSQKRLLT